MNKGIIDNEMYIQLMKLKTLDKKYLSVILNELKC